MSETAGSIMSSVHCPVSKGDTARIKKEQKLRELQDGIRVRREELDRIRGNVGGSINGGNDATYPRSN